jgi:hypothetical protein
MPRHPGLDLVEADVLIIRQQYFTDEPSIGPLVLAIERDVLARENLGKMPGRLRSEGLVVFGRVDAFQPDGVGKTGRARLPYRRR